MSFRLYLDQYPRFVGNEAKGFQEVSLGMENWKQAPDLRPLATPVGVTNVELVGITANEIHIRINNDFVIKAITEEGVTLIKNAKQFWLVEVPDLWLPKVPHLKEVIKWLIQLQNLHPNTNLTKILS